MLTVAPLVALVAWTVPLFHIHIPNRIVIVAAVIAWVVIAAAVHSRVSNDWRAQYSLDRMEADHRTSVAPNVSITKK